MKILHGTWIPNSSDEFVQAGNFYLWVETDTPPNQQKNRATNRHPQQLNKGDLSTFLSDELGITVPKNGSISREIVTKYFILPSTDDRPLPSVELTRYLETESPAPTTWQTWAIDCYRVNPIVKLLNDIHFLCLYSTETQMGADLLCWYHYSQSIRELLHKDRYIPALKYRDRSPLKAKGKKTSPSPEIYPGWEIVSEVYETKIQQYINYLPLACTGGLNAADAPIEFYDKETLLRHFSECLLHDYVANTPIPATFEKKIANSRLITGCLNLQESSIPWTDSQALTIYKQWQTWKQKLVAAQNNSTFQLCFQLQEASTQNPDRWYLKFLVAAKQDPSLKLELDDYWHLDSKTKQNIHRQFGKEFEKDLLLNLGYAARIYPQIWQGLETDKPVGFFLTLTDAFDFLAQSAWVLEDAGYKTIVPAWWTPQGRARAKLRLKASPKKSGTSKADKGLFHLDNLIDYRYELAIGDEQITPQEWQKLVDAKAPLIHFRGQWMELDLAKMQQMLQFWQSHQDTQPELRESQEKIDPIVKLDYLQYL